MAATAQTKRLGRGLASLIGDLETESRETGNDAGQRTIPLGAIRPSPLNPRRVFRESELEELANSIREKGLVQPIIVRPREGSDTEFEIVAGERRWRAAQRVSLHDIPVIVRTLSDREALELAIVENVQRTDLNAIEEGLGYNQLMTSFEYKQEELAAVVGKSRSHVANTLRLLRLPESVQVLVREAQLSAGHARALVGRPDADAIAKDIVKKSLNVRDVEALVQSRAGAPKGTTKNKKRELKDADTRAAEAELADALGLAVTIKSGKGESGELRIRYGTLDQLEDVRRRLLSRKRPK